MWIVLFLVIRAFEEILLKMTSLYYKEKINFKRTKLICNIDVKPQV